MEESELDELERYLESAEVLNVATFSATTAHPSVRLILKGGVAVLAKAADTAPEGVIMCHREASAWVVARALGWSDLLAATVIRMIMSPTSGEEVETSVQVIWPDYLPDADLGLFSDDDIWRAAVFDSVVGHADRGGHNWLAVPGSIPSPRLKLVDHGYAFPETTSAPSSTFYESRKGERLPDEAMEALTEFVGRRDELDRLHGLLPGGAADAVFERAQAVLATATLEIS